MNLIGYAVDRLSDTGWRAEESGELETLPDGRRFPSVLAVQQAFAKAGLELRLKQNLMFSCYRATWAPLGQPLDDDHQADDRHGTVVGACPREASVYALAQMRRAAREHELASV